jgi:hypothetical protein
MSEKIPSISFSEKGWPFQRKKRKKKSNGKTKYKKIEKKNICPTPPEDQAICLFAGFLPNPDMVLSHEVSIHT